MASCVPGSVNADCRLCDFHQRLAAPVLPAEVAEEQRIRDMVEAVNRSRRSG